MAHVNLLVYLLMCPFNVRHMLDAPSFAFRLRSKRAKDETFMYGASGGENLQNYYPPHDEVYMFELAKIYYEFMLKYKMDVRQGQEENYDLVVSSFGKESNRGLSLQTVRVTNDVIYLSYQNVQKESGIHVKLNRGKISTYLDLLRFDSCLYKLNSEDYNLMKRASDHSKPVMLSTYHIYILLTVFSLCTYVEKSLLLEFPALKKYHVFLTLCLVFFPIISYLFFLYIYVSIFGVLLIYAFFYALFRTLSRRRRGKGGGHQNDNQIGNQNGNQIGNQIGNQNGNQNGNKNDQNTDEYTDHRRSSIGNPQGEVETQEARRNKCLVHMRLANLCITYVCIFAVDFYFFPRQFSKSFFFGNTLMDLGVGGCITSSAYSLNRKKILHSTNRRGGIIEWKYFFLFFLGIARYIAVKLFNYNYSLTEYGMHWNFFLTLFFTLLVCNALLTLIKRIRHIFLLSCVLICVYEFFIWHLNITSYFLEDHTERTHFFSLNREGLMNVIGSINLYLFSFSLWNGYVMQDEIQQGKGEQSEGYIQLSPVCFTLKLFTMSLMFYLIHLLLNYYGNYSVRILCNANYICVISSVSLFAVALSYLVEAILLREKTTAIPVLQKMNRHTLGVFLFCNITMGTFNLLFQSLLFPLFFACIILAAYSYGMLCFASMLPGPAEREMKKEKHY
ncbi:GPI-anchored wall transfer protein 1, putative [Plasmodium knowlesi strain H]|uniref:GPI-anchored wall transfer protein 1, putative n=3 Tax=Plasmodium knowlesi TaxID=5850 RepID=A0A5K1U5Q9_PLAKH|nr:GPI-anchored wall transfer protein 1, putative [Plasmodium knowlesi strain H]OTN64695.1 putative GPI-anchored wall transfer protein 1 [Plasmodium knowlesi]CAA9989172.1 GPI-anchored wall transfer protein 1, putative [Plasmodium knowlesi strain H]SBO27392.1 GPI-anchored wall transfer protein 1, putative [Plasmodium knowlesi strain H]SBO27498.1 GPI-anchored wall transfer protein 1, putative [Plasmodium knowlesi strain H]VVS78646.1 GPI-anchored wall transfer protein 1, putative [Plasmodium know|eukprot:XP_002261519.1 hypothetical protein, conserved in Plasmodium species [Plasmodium knowlesi strain H]